MFVGMDWASFGMGWLVGLFVAWAARVTWCSVEADRVEGVRKLVREELARYTKQ